MTHPFVSTGVGGLQLRGHLYANCDVSNGEVSELHGPMVDIALTMVGNGEPVLLIVE
jgi:hypothetical protein